MKLTADLKSQDIIKYIEGLYGSLMLDMSLPKRDTDCFNERFHHEGWGFITDTLPILGKALDQALGSKKFKCPSNFKRRKTSEALPALLGSLFRRIFSVSGDLLDEADVVAIMALRQICFLSYKLNLPYKESKENAIIQNFIDVEKELEQLDFEDDAILSTASLLIGQLFRDYDRDTLKPRHGPGATANFRGCDKFEKVLDPLPVTSYFGEKFFVNYRDGMDRLSRYPVRAHRDYFDVKLNCARVILVPKDSRGPRLISCEPVENQWIQQGIMDYMVKTVENNELTAGHVNFTDQSINRDLAIEGSKAQLYSTLDLKDASDRVSLRLVERLFRRVPELHSDLLRSRSDYTQLPNGDKIRLSKFAPMGSACCFPVLAVSVWALCASYVLGLTGDITEALGSVYVYGDDVIIKTPYAPKIADLFSRYGLLVNTNKSFINSRFCESCGMDSFDGNDVSLIRLRELWQFSPLSRLRPDILQKTVAFGNNLYLSGYNSTAEYVFKHVEKATGKLPYGSKTSPYICRIKRMPSDIFNHNSTSKWVTRKKMNDIVLYPYGYIFKAISIEQVNVEVETSLWAHLSRVLPMMGVDAVLPSEGVFPEVGHTKYRRRFYSHYDM